MQFPPTHLLSPSQPSKKISPVASSRFRIDYEKGKISTSNSVTSSSKILQRRCETTTTAQYVLPYIAQGDD